MGIIAGAWTIVWRGTLSPNMPTPTPDFEKNFIQAIRANLLEVIIQLDAGDKNLRKKIDTFSSRFKFLKSEVEKKIRETICSGRFFRKILENKRYMRISPPDSSRNFLR